MKTETEIKTYRVDDIPLLLAQQQKLGLAELLDEQIKPHGNRQGLSIGWTVVGWLSYILSQADHRLSYVESWASDQHDILQKLIPKEVSVGDFTDDRLGDVLSYLSDDESWSAIEATLGQRLIQVYEIPTERVHLDSTSAAVYHSPEGKALIEYGYSKDHRPDLAQLKVMMSSLAPMGMPLATLVVPGNQADDELYLPAIKQSRKVLNRRGVLYIGDSKMEALNIRATIAAGGYFYLTPLSKKGTQSELLHELLNPVWSEAQELTAIYDQTDGDSPKRLLARAFEITRRQAAIVEESDEPFSWDERVLVVYSPTLAESHTQSLLERLRQAEENLIALTPKPGRGKRQWSDLPPLEAAATAILKRYNLWDLFLLSYERQESQQQKRKYKDRPACTETIVRYQIHVTRNEDAIAKHQRTLGWRLFVTNFPVQRCSISDAVHAYREAPIHERNFSRLKNRPLGLRPLFVHREDRIVGLVRLLSLALRLLTLVEFVVTQELQQQDTSLTGLYEGNPTRTTQRPTTERLLRAFLPITLTVVSLPGQRIFHLTPLTSLQRQILTLLGLPDSIYQDLARDFNAIPP
jgi:transposase